MFLLEFNKPNNLPSIYSWMFVFNKHFTFTQNTLGDLYLYDILKHKICKTKNILKN